MTLAPWTSGRLKTELASSLHTELTSSPQPELASSPQPEIASSLQLRLQKHAMRLSEPSSWVEAALGASKPQVFFLEAAGITVDASRQAWDAPLREDLAAWSLLQGLANFRDQQFQGEVVNLSEGRAARHSLMRAPDACLHAEGLDEIARTRSSFLAFADEIRSNPDINHLIHIGIGGSDLGPRLLVQALAPLKTHSPLKLHFAGNGDLHELEAMIAEIDPLQAQIVLCSKSFTTPETLLNAERLKSWMEARQAGLFGKRSVAVTSNLQAAAAFGVSRSFAFPDWVGGRYSLWSPISLSAAAFLGSEMIQDFLSGAWAMDQHWLEAEPQHNLPWQLGLLDVWNRNAMGFRSRCVVPYDSRLSRLPSYLQQLEMESNGKFVDQAGEVLAYSSAPLVWGEAGTNAQHSFFQWLHQGSDPTPVEFVLVERAEHEHADAHRRLLANALAQSLALIKGKSFHEALAETVKTANPAWSQDKIAPHRVFPGGRPSTILSMSRLDAKSLGALIALYEHRVAVAGFLWGVNPYDQWGVELGKVLAIDIEAHMLQNRDHADAQTARWIHRLIGGQR